MEENMMEHGGVLISGIIAITISVMLFTAIVVIGNMGVCSLTTIIGG